MLDWRWVANAALASIAAGVNIWAAQGAPKLLRPARLAIGFLALVYAVGITWGLVTDQIERWTSIGRVVGLFAWVLVWIVPAIASRHDRRRIVANIEGLMPSDRADSDPLAPRGGWSPDGDRPSDGEPWQDGG